MAPLNALTGADPPIEPRPTVAVEDTTGGAQAARAAEMWVARIRGLGYDPASRYGDILIERLHRASLERMLALGFEGRS